jgi:hypothetical protein
MAARARESVVERYQARRLVGDVDRLYQELLTVTGYHRSAAAKGADA